MANYKRYVPPGARQKETAGATTKNAEDSQRSLDDLVQDKGGDVFVVKLRSKNKYSKYSMWLFYFLTYLYMPWWWVGAASSPTNSTSAILNLHVAYVLFR